MTKKFQGKISIAWGTITAFALLALIWHVPLLVAPVLVPSRKHSSAVPVPERYLILQPGVESVAVEDQPAWDDPTIFLLPRNIGFSSRVRQRTMALRVEQVAADPPALPPLERVEATRRTGDAVALALAQTAFNAWDAESQVRMLPTETLAEEGSAWRAVGTIAERQPAATSALPSLLAVEPLGASVVRVGVGPQGEARFVILERSSGWEKADEAAIQFVRGIRFSALEVATEELAWGFVKILWRVDRALDKR